MVSPCARSKQRTSNETKRAPHHRGGERDRVVSDFCVRSPHPRRPHEPSTHVLEQELLESLTDRDQIGVRCCRHGGLLSPEFRGAGRPVMPSGGYLKFGDFPESGCTRPPGYIRAGEFSRLCPPYRGLLGAFGGRPGRSSFETRARTLRVRGDISSRALLSQSTDNTSNAAAFGLCASAAQPTQHNTCPNGGNPMNIRETRGPSRRELVKTAAAAGVAASVGPFFHATPARAAKTLKILQWSHFVPAYDKWFNNEYTKDWGKKNDTEVIVDNINLALIESRAAAEVSAQRGHDLVLFLAPPAVFEDQVVDMKDVYAECEKKHGKAIDLAIKSTYNPKTKRFFAFSDSFVPDPIDYRTDLWGDAGMKPDSWDEIRTGGKKIKDKTGIPVGI